MSSIKKTARIAGLLYLLNGITGAFGMVIIPSKMIVAGNPTVTVNNILASMSLFRLSIVSTLICQILFVYLVLALYRLLKGVNEKQASLMVTLVVVSVPITFLNLLNQIAPLVILSGADFLKVFEPDQLNALVMFFLNLYKHGIMIVGIFWGLWLYPFGYLVFKSGFLPKTLGVLLIINCFGYLVDSFTFLLIPHYYDLISKFTMAPMVIGEFATVLWLLIKGVKNQKPASIEAG